MSLLLALVGGGGGAATVNAVGDAALGGLSSTTTATVTHNATGTAPLGGLSSTTTATVTHSATGTASLGGLASSTTATVTHLATGTAPLGGLTSTIVVPGTTTPDDEGTHSGGFARPRRKPTAAELKLLQPKRLPRLPNTIVAAGVANLGGLSSTAVGVVTWSIHADDEELVLV